MVENRSRKSSERGSCGRRDGDSRKIKAKAADEEEEPMDGENCETHDARKFIRNFLADIPSKVCMVRFQCLIVVSFSDFVFLSVFQVCGILDGSAKICNSIFNNIRLPVCSC